MKRALFALILVASTASAGIVDDVIAAYGGAEAWKKVKSFRQVGTVASPMRPAPGQVTRLWTRPDKLTIEITYPTSKEVRVVDGDHGTQNGKEATGMGLAAMRLQAARLAIPVLLADHRATVREHVIDVALAPGLTVTLEVDPQTNRVVRSVGKGEGIEFATTYSDFRTVDGLLFPFAKVEINP